MMKMNGRPSGPMEMMCEMMGKMGGAQPNTGAFPAELCHMFEEWVAHLENEIIEKNAGTSNAQVETVMEQLGIGKESAIYLIARLAVKDKLKLSISI